MPVRAPRFVLALLLVSFAVLPGVQAVAVRFAVPPGVQPVVAVAADSLLETLVVGQGTGTYYRPSSGNTCTVPIVATVMYSHTGYGVLALDLVGDGQLFGGCDVGIAGVALLTGSPNAGFYGTGVFGLAECIVSAGPFSPATHIRIDCTYLSPLNPNPSSYSIDGFVDFGKPL